MPTRTYFYNLHCEKTPQEDDYEFLVSELHFLPKKQGLEISIKDERNTQGIWAVVLSVTTPSFFLPIALRGLIKRYQGIYTGKSRVQTPSTSTESGTTA